MKAMISISVIALAAVLPQSSAAQIAADTNAPQAYMTRLDLQAEVDRLMLFAASPAYSEMTRERARQEAALIQARLTFGDFRVGDRILLTVDNQPALSDTFLVDQGPVLTLANIGDVPLRGVLRSELRTHVTQYLRTFLREPIVRARGLVRISIMGAVGNPGFYTLPGELIMTDAIMAAGGPAPNAKIDEVRVERGDLRVWEGDRLRQAMIEGRTLDQLDLRAGDRILIPEVGGGFAGAGMTLRTLTLVLSIPATIVALVAIF
jgi:protein involved in polysaccharide export with SLBB domain